MAFFKEIIYLSRGSCLVDTLIGLVLNALLKKLKDS